MINLFNTRKSFVSSGLLKSVTDIHCHILPGVDDGVKRFTQSVEALQWLYAQGIIRVYLTPHIMAEFPDNTRTFLNTSFCNFLHRLAGVGEIPELRLGAEYMLDPSFDLHVQEGLMCYANNHVLIETSYFTPPLDLDDIIERLFKDNYSPVLAHPERYRYMDMDDYKAFKTQGVLFQLNFLSMVGAYGKQAQDKAEQLLSEGYYNFAGSDFHNLKRHEATFMLRKLSKSTVNMLMNLFENNNKLW
jgi:tyrosine-protein phosphatase YwqE